MTKSLSQREGVAAPSVSIASMIFGFIVDIVSVSRERHSLRNLDGAALRDVGLTPASAMREADRPFWDLPTRFRG